MRKIITRGEHTLNPYKKKSSTRSPNPYKSLKNLKETYAATLCYYATSFGRLSPFKGQKPSSKSKKVPKTSQNHVYP